MTREEKYEEIVNIIQKNENRLLSEKDGNSLRWHLKRLKTYFTDISSADAILKKNLELDFDVSVKEIEMIFEQQNWK